MSEMLDPNETSAVLHVPSRTLAQWRYLGRGPKYVRVGNHVRYRRDDLEAWIDENTVTPANTGTHRAAIGGDARGRPAA